MTRSMAGMRVYSDIFRLENINQNVGVAFTKNIIIDHLRNIFKQDRFYKYRDDMFGFPLVGDLTGETAEIAEEDTTRIFIGSLNKYEISFTPAIFVSNKSLSYEPISFNQNLEEVIYTKQSALTYSPTDPDARADGYVVSETRVPSHKVFTGAWKVSVNVKVISESSSDLEEIADICNLAFQGPRRLELQREGVFIRGLSTTGENKRAYLNDGLYTTDITLDIRTEWKIHIPINNLLERIALYIVLTDENEDSIDGLVINNRITL